MTAKCRVEDDFFLSIDTMLLRRLSEYCRPIALISSLNDSPVYKTEVLMIHVSICKQFDIVQDVKFVLCMQAKHKRQSEGFCEPIRRAQKQDAIYL